MVNPRELPMRIPESLGEAGEIQEAVARKVAAAPPVPLGRVRRVAGADASYSTDGRTVHAAAAILALPDLRIIEESHVTREALFPYLPGFFAFREGPAVIAAIGALAKEPHPPQSRGVAPVLQIVVRKPRLGARLR